MLQVYDLTRSPLAVGFLGVSARRCRPWPWACSADRSPTRWTGASWCWSPAAAWPWCPRHWPPKRSPGWARSGCSTCWWPCSMRSARWTARAQHVHPGPAASARSPPGWRWTWISFQLMLIAGWALAGIIAAAPHLGLRACYLVDAMSYAAALYGVGLVARAAAAGRPVAARPAGGSRGDPVHPAQPGAGPRVPGRPVRHRVRSAGGAVPGPQRGTLWRRSTHARLVHDGHRRRRPGQRVCLARWAGCPGPAGRCWSPWPSGVRRSPVSRSFRPCCG